MEKLRMLLSIGGQQFSSWDQIQKLTAASVHKYYEHVSCLVLSGAYNSQSRSFVMAVKHLKMQQTST